MGARLVADVLNCGCWCWIGVSRGDCGDGDKVIVWQRGRDGRNWRLRACIWAGIEEISVGGNDRRSSRRGRRRSQVTVGFEAHDVVHLVEEGGPGGFGAIGFAVR